MGVHHLTGTSRYHALDLCISAVESGVSKYNSVDVIAASSEEAEFVKLALCKKQVMGANVQTLSQWLVSQWEIWGDGCPLAGDSERHILLRPVLSEMTGLEPSASYVKQFSAFIQNAYALDVQLQESGLANALSRYQMLLEAAGMKDPAFVARHLSDHCIAKSVIFFCLDIEAPFVRACLDSLEQRVPVTVVHRCLPCEESSFDLEERSELQQLRKTLFTGQGGLRSTGAFAALEVHGIHVETAAVVKLVRRALDAGNRPSQIAVVLPSTGIACSEFAQALAQADIPVSCQYSVPLGQTHFGASVLELEGLLSSEDDGWSNTAAFLASPYSGMQDEDARAFAMMWRSQNGSTKEGRLNVLAQGLRKRVPTKVWDEKLESIRQLAAAPTMAERIRLMFENGKRASFDLERMADDAAVANKLLAYLNMCELLGCDPHMKDIEQLSIPLTCSYGEGDEGFVRICDSAHLTSLQGIEHVVMARLSKDDYPMAQMPGPFDRYLREAGCEFTPNTAMKNRLLLLDALELGKSFVCYRLTTDAEGSERCQSALWDELMTSYRTQEDEDMPVHALPSELVSSGNGLKMAEADGFQGSRQTVRHKIDVRRGEVEDAALDLLFPDAEHFNESFSPTAIEDYYRCPYRWLICRRIGANSIDKSFDQIAKGNLAHNVLERLYLNMHQQGISRVTSENLKQCLELADEAFEWQRQHDVDKHELVLQTAREWEESEFIRRQVKELVQRDAVFLPGFTPVYLELKLETPDGAPLTYAGVPVRGKVDRIDVDENGRAVVIDYKLSSLSTGYGLSKEGGLPARIQTDIYALLVQRCLDMQGVDIQVVGSVYRSYAKNNLRGVYASGIDWGPLEKVRSDLDGLPGGACLDSYETYLQNVEKRVADLLDQVKSGDVRPNPLCDDACEHCLAQGFCHERRR